MENKFGNQIFRKTEEDSFVNITFACSFLTKPGMFWTDFKDDGRLDIYIGDEGANVRYFNQGNFRFLDLTVQTDVGDTLISKCPAANYSNDGNLDIFMANSFFTSSYENANVLLKNNDNQHHWLHLKLIGRASNRATNGRATLAELCPLYRSWPDRADHAADVVAGN